MRRVTDTPSHTLTARSHTSVPPPTPQAFAEKFMTQFAAGFKENNHATTLAGLLAEKISWDWSDDSKGDGTPDDLTGMFSKSWGAMVDSFNLLAKQVVVDTTHSKVLVTGQLIINITGGLADETNLVHNDICFIFTLNDKEQVTHWEVRAAMHVARPLCRVV